MHDLLYRYACLVTAINKFHHQSSKKLFAHQNFLLNTEH